MDKFVTKEIRDIIGFNEFLQEMELKTAYGKTHLQKTLNKFFKKDELEREYRLIKYFIDVLQRDKLNGIEILLSNIKDIRSTFKACLEEQTLDLIEFYEIKYQAFIMQSLKDTLIRVLPKDGIKLHDCKRVLDILAPHENNLEPSFYLYDEYSANLRDIRIKKQRIESIISETTNEAKLATLQERRQEILKLEEEEELRVRTILTLRLANEVNMLIENAIIIGEIDCLVEKAKLAYKYQQICPVISEDNLVLNDMTHPMIEKHLPNDFTKNSIVLKPGTSILTGANMGGKSTILKTIAFNIVLAQFGFYVSATHAEIPLFSKLHFLTKETEDKSHGLSSFGNELTKLNYVIEHLDDHKQIVFVDEFASSTNPYEGQFFIKALAKYFQNNGVYSLIATHYDFIGTTEMTYYQMKGLKNGRDFSEADNIYDLMDYSLEEVSFTESVPHDAYNIAKLLKVDSRFMAELENVYKGEVDE